VVVDNVEEYAFDSQSSKRFDSHENKAITNDSDSDTEKEDNLVSHSELLVTPKANNIGF
jgi:hypothetical protein